MIDMYPLLQQQFTSVKVFYFVQCWFYFLAVGLSVESCCDDSEEKIVNDQYKMNTCAAITLRNFFLSVSLLFP